MEWTQNANEVAEAERVIEVRDSCCTYYAALPACMTEEDAVEEFVRTYQYHESGTEAGLRAELDSRVRTRAAFAEEVLTEARQERWAYEDPVTGETCYRNTRITSAGAYRVE